MSFAFIYAYLWCLWDIEGIFQTDAEVLDNFKHGLDRGRIEHLFECLFTCLIRQYLHVFSYYYLNWPVVKASSD